MSIVNNFHNKIVSAQRNVHIIEIFSQGTTEKGAFQRDFFFMRGIIMHVLDLLFFKSSNGGGRLLLFTHKVLVGLSGQIGFAPKIALKC